MIHVIYCLSPFACIPLRFAFEEETTENSQRECQRLKEQVDNLHSYSVPDSNLEIDFSGFCTMIDGKVRLLWSEGGRATQNCPVCNASPYKDMKNRHGNFQPNPRRLAFGFSPLHCRMKVFG